MADTVADAPNINTSVDIFEHLSNIPDDKPESKPTKEDKETPDEEEELDLNLPEIEDEEDEEESEEEPEKIDLDDEKEESELELAKIPTGKQIKEKYPNIFKEFPALEHIFYREKEYASVFPTVKDAKSARESINEYNTLQEDLLNGDITGVLAQVKNTNPKAYNKIASNILESLNKIDPVSIKEPSVAVLKTTLFNLNQLAARSLKSDPNNKRAEQLQIATELINEAIFNTSEVSSYQRSEEDRLNPEREALNREKAELDNRKFSEAHGKVTGRFSDLLSKAIDKNIDPRSVLSPYLKGKVSDDVKNELDRQLMSDKRFEGIVKKLYERARSENYSQQSLDNILTALKNKAASILPEIIRAKKGEALKGSSAVRQKTRELSRQKDDGENDASTRSSSRMTRGERRESNDNGPKPGESAFDYLNRKLGD